MSRSRSSSRGCSSPIGSFDRVLQIAVSEARAEWEANGSPSGYFWKPEGSRPLSLRMRGFIWSHWFLHRPSWTTSSRQAEHVYTLFRLVSCFVFLSFLPLFFTACPRSRYACFQSPLFHRLQVAEVAGHSPSPNNRFEGANPLRGFAPSTYALDRLTQTMALDCSSRTY